MASQAGGAKLTPNLVDQESTRALNLTVLQRLDPAVEEILITAGAVTLYHFSTQLNEWSRKDVEGSLFVVKRNTQPRFQFVVMNRRHTANLVEDLLGDFEYELQTPYILYRNAAQEVNGIWFYNTNDCEAVANLFSRILNAYSKVPPKSKVSPAKSEFNNAALEGPLEPPTSSTARPVTDVQDEPFLAFLSQAAASSGDASNAPVAGQPLQLFGSAPPSTHAPSIAPSQPLAMQFSPPLQASSVPGMPHNAHEHTNGVNSGPTNLLKPLFFSPLTSSQSMMPPITSSVPTAPPLHPPLTGQKPLSAPLLQPFPLPTVSPSPPYGTPLLQPFPPPNPSPSLTPAPTTGPLMTRDKVHDALLRLVQNESFIDMVYREITSTHQHS